MFEKALLSPHALTELELTQALACEDVGFERELFAAARELKCRLGKDKVLERGLIEVSNCCGQNCHYCGIRSGNLALSRYRLDENEVQGAVREAVKRGYPAVAFQAGELRSEENTVFYERLIRQLPPELELTLSLGEQSEDTYRRWQQAAGNRVLRYLLRIESSQRELFAQIHPADISFDERHECIRTLKRLGYVTGSGVMIGLPGQTIRDLACDLMFYEREHLDMVGMGPFIPALDTPMSNVQVNHNAYCLTLKMIALTRLQLWNVNIVAATSLEAMNENGRNEGVAAGANVVMPNLTPERGRLNYRLYPGKTECVK